MGSEKGQMGCVLSRGQVLDCQSTWATLTCESLAWDFAFLPCPLPCWDSPSWSHGSCFPHMKSLRCLTRVPCPSTALSQASTYSPMWHALYVRCNGLSLSPPHAGCEEMHV